LGLVARLLWMSLGAALVLAGVWLGGRSLPHQPTGAPPAIPPAAGTPPAEVDTLAEAPPASEWSALRDLLGEEIEARERLEEEVRSLEVRLAELGEGVASPDAPGTVTPPRTRAEAGSATSGWLDREALASSALPADAVAEIEERFAAAEMELLYVQDQAAREEWSTGRRHRELRDLRQRRDREIREELGDESYDWFLYASGRPNRVEVRDVLRDSPAGSADVEAGDAILRYAGARIFSPRELRDATRAGRAGSLVAIDLVRGEEELRVYVPRGPLGIQMHAARTRPSG
jgi:hypothetical protein